MKTKADYFALYEERPRKWTAEDVGFMFPTAKDDRICAACMNWFYSPVMMKSVCQIYRPTDDGNVEAEGSCAFWTRDNEHFPKLEE